MHESLAVIITLAVLILFVTSIRRMLIWQPTWRSFTIPDRAGLIDNDSYNVEHYSEDTATVCLKYTGENLLRFTLEAPFAYSGPLADKLRQPLEALSKLGADYLDVGFYADWIAAEIPCNSPAMRSHMPDAFFRKAAAELVRLRAVALEYSKDYCVSGMRGSDPSETSLPSSMPSLSVSGSSGLVPRVSSSPSGRPSRSVSEEK